MKRFFGPPAAIVYGSAVVILVCCVLAATCRPAAGLSVMEQCIGASCKITSTNGTCGSGCAYWIGFDSRGQRVIRVMTAAHVLSMNRATCKFGRRGVTATGTVVKRDPGKDVGVIAIPWSAFREGTWPPVVPLDSPQMVMPAYTVVFSVGCPNGCWPMKFWRGRTLGYEQDRRLRVWPGIELGRSGSPLFRYHNKRATLVGVLHSRNSRRLHNETIGYAASIQVIHAVRGTVTKTAWPCASEVQWAPPRYTHFGPIGWTRHHGGGGNVTFALPSKSRIGDMEVELFAILTYGSSVTPCVSTAGWGPSGCPPVGGLGSQNYDYPPGFDRFHLDPYRRQQQKRDQYLYRKIQKNSEQSQGTLPLPPIAPEVDLGPLSSKLDILIQGNQGASADVKVLVAEIERLRVDVDALKVTEAAGRALVDQLSRDFPAVQEAVAQIRGDVADADEKAVDATEIAGDAEAKAADAEILAVGAEKMLAETLDESNPAGLFARLKDRIGDRVSTTMVGKVAAAKGWGFAGAGLGLAGLVLGGIALLIRRDFRDRRETGDPLLIEKLLARGQGVAERTSTGIDDKAVSTLAALVEKLADRRAPKPEDKE